MITGFEDITRPLSDDELKIVPVLCNNFKRHDKNNPVKAPVIVTGMNKYLVQHGYKIRMSQARLRKCCNFIRSKGMIPLIATSNGYYVSYNKEDVANQIKSLWERAGAIRACANGLQKFLSTQ